MVDKCLILFTAVLACSSTLDASTIGIVPDASYQVGITFQDGSMNGVGLSGSAAGIYSLGPTKATIVSGDPALSLQVSSGLYGEGAATVLYSFSVAGAPDNTTVPLLVFYNLSAAGGEYVDSEEGIAAAILHVGTAIDSASVAAQGNDYIANQSLSGFLKVNYWTANQEAGGSIRISASADGPSSSASAEDFIEVDPSFANAADYSIVVSQGIGNSQASDAPEPASFALAGIALCTAGLLRRRKAVGPKKIRVK